MCAYSISTKNDLQGVYALLHHQSQIARTPRIRHVLIARVEEQQADHPAKDAFSAPRSFTKGQAIHKPRISALASMPVPNSRPDPTQSSIASPQPGTKANCSASRLEAPPTQVTMATREQSTSVFFSERPIQGTQVIQTTPREVTLCWTSARSESSYG